MAQRVSKKMRTKLFPVPSRHGEELGSVLTTVARRPAPSGRQTGGVAEFPAHNNRWSVERYLQNPSQRPSEAATSGSDVLSRLDALEVAVKALQEAK